MSAYYVDGAIGSMLYAPASVDASLGGNTPSPMGSGMLSCQDKLDEEETVVFEDEEEDEIYE